MIELNPYIILSKPQLGENIGSTARAMKNFGIKNLLLVQPRDGWPNNSAFAPAAGADDVLNQAKLYDSISEATKTISLLFATTARKRVVGTKSLSIFIARALEPIFSPSCGFDKIIYGLSSIINSSDFKVFSRLFYLVYLLIVYSFLIMFL